MDPGGRPALTPTDTQTDSHQPIRRRFLARVRVLRASDISLYKCCEHITEALVYLMVVFSPWAFGTTQPWSKWTMNAAGYMLGLLLVLKLWVRWTKGYRPARWDAGGTVPSSSRGFAFGKRATASSQEPERRLAAGLAQSQRRKPVTDRRSEHTVTGPDARPELEVEASHEPEGRARHSVRASLGSNEVGAQRTDAPCHTCFMDRLSASLAALTVAILAYCLISAVNARATYRPQDFTFVYHDQFVPWLPYSLDSTRTWAAFWSYLALACSFWAVCDWLAGKSEGEQLAQYAEAEGAGRGAVPRFPDRLRRLLWVMAINGGLLGLEGILQRLEGSGHLLFLVKPRVNPGADTQFGPYAYRGNASAWFNLLWPVCLGFWWMLHRSGGRKTHLLLLVCAGIMAASPVISTSRAGTFIALGLLMACTALLLVSGLLLRTRKKRRAALTLVVVFCATALTLGYALGWTNLKQRMGKFQGDFAHREEMYDRAKPMAADYPVWGTGPGTFGTVFQFYRDPERPDWPAQLHNDWLETRITFGWVGSALIALALVLVLLRWFAGGGIHGGRRLVVLTCLALAGCLVHARYDFPFQIHSIVFLFLMLCAILFSLGRRA